MHPVNRTSEMEHDPDPREVEQLLTRLELPRRTEYTSEISARAIALLQTRAHNEWQHRLDAEERARLAESWLKDTQEELQYVQKWNVRMVAILAVMIGLLCWEVMR